MSVETQVLVVEDDALLRLDIVDHLAGQGFQVFESGNAADALYILENNFNIQVIITDIDMPGPMNGLKLAEAVRNRWPPMKIIVVSGHRIVEITDLPDGSMFFSKPYSLSHIVSSMRQMLRN